MGRMRNLAGFRASAVLQRAQHPRFARRSASFAAGELPQASLVALQAELPRLLVLHLGGRRDWASPFCSLLKDLDVRHG